MSAGTLQPGHDPRPNNPSDEPAECQAHSIEDALEHAVELLSIAKTWHNEVLFAATHLGNNPFKIADDVFLKRIGNERFNELALELSEVMDCLASAKRYGCEWKIETTDARRAAGLVVR